MTKPRILPGLVLCGVLLAACATATVAPAQPTVVEPSDTPSLIPTAKSTLSVDLTATYTLELLSATPAVHAQPVATSRGPELHATDPTTVNLAAGQLQLVEFFRFT